MNYFKNLNSFWNLKEPRDLSKFLAIIGLILSLLLFYPINQVFHGSWKLKQTIIIAENVSFDLNNIGLAHLASNTGGIFALGTVSIRFYSLFVLVGLLAGYALALYLSKFQFIAGTIVDRLIIGLIIFGVIGARLFFVIFKWSEFEQNPLLIITDTTTGGMAIFGTIFFSLAYIYFYCSRFKFNFFEFLDFLAPALLLGQVIGRWGNFFNYEAYGQETSVYWKMFVPETANYYADINARYFHPTFLYEIIPNFFLLLFILFYYKQLTEKKSGLIFAIYAIGYGLIRFVTEFYRLDALRLYLPGFLQLNLGVFGEINYLLASQISAIILFFLGLITYLQRNKIIYLKKNMTEFKIS